ncbi:MAG TPA: DUF1284 domain-containing protein [Stenomitos sp.]
MDDSTNLLPLRAHHLMCVTTYQGKGYSPEFVANMNRVWHALRAGAYSHAKATSVADPLCMACPNLQDQANDTSCRYHVSISERDRRMLAAMGWQEGEIIELGSVMDDIHARHAALMNEVCVGCDWTAICSERRFTLREADPPVPLPLLNETPQGSLP